MFLKTYILSSSLKAHMFILYNLYNSIVTTTTISWLYLLTVFFLLLFLLHPYSYFLDLCCCCFLLAAALAAAFWAATSGLSLNQSSLEPQNIVRNIQITKESLLVSVSSVNKFQVSLHLFYNKFFRALILFKSDAQLELILQY